MKAFSVGYSNKIDEALDDSKVETRKLKQQGRNLKEQKDDLKQLDNDTLKRMYDADETDEVCDDEAKGTSDIMEKIEFNLICLEDALKSDGYRCDAESSSMHRSVSQESVISNESRISKMSSKLSSKLSSQVQVNEGQSPRHVVRVKLLKIDLQKFSGKMEHWQEFWDSFKSAIHELSGLAKVDKFKYLRSYLEEPVRKVIGGLSITDADYDSGIKILKNRYARPTQIKRAHISQLLQLSMVHNEKNIAKLRQCKMTSKRIFVVLKLWV